MNVVFRCRASRALQNVDHPRQPDNVRLIIESPLVRVHQPVVVPVHLLIHPDRIGHVQADGHPQLAALFPQRIHARIVRMHPRRLRLSRSESLALVVDLPHAARTRLLAALQFLDGSGPEPRLVDIPRSRSRTTSQSARDTSHTFG